jgi:hypothetical protein
VPGSLPARVGGYPPVARLGPLLPSDWINFWRLTVAGTIDIKRRSRRQLHDQPVEPDPTDKRRRRLVTTASNAHYWQVRNEADHAAVAQWF